MNVLETHNLSIGYPAERRGHADAALLSDLNLSLPEASVTVLLGANGAGKSTLLRTISGVQAPLSGKVTIGGAEISSLSANRRARLLALVYTDRTGGGGLTVAELVGLGRQPYTGFLGRLSREDREIVDEALAAVGMTHKAYSHVASLSDGERQKAMIARALAQQTPMILLDEPTSFLDVASRFEILQLLSRLSKDQSKTILLSTHDIAPAMAIADRLWIIDSEQHTLLEGHRSQLVAEGAMDRIFRNHDITFDPEIGDFRFS